MKVPAENLIGEEGKGFRYILSGMNAERVLIASECVGDGQAGSSPTRQRLCQGASGVRPPDRPEPGRPVPDRQGLCRAMRAAELMVKKRCADDEAGMACGAEANMAKMLAADASGSRRPMPASRRMAASALPRNTTSSASSARRGCTRWRRSPPT
jgi:acyl-CoA dehydrogenase